MNAKEDRKRDTVNLTIRINRQLKREMEEVLESIGLTTTAAITVYAKRIAREKAIPFRLSDPDSFYSESNLRALEKSRQQHREGKVVVKTLEELQEME